MRLHKSGQATRCQRTIPPLRSARHTCTCITVYIHTLHRPGQWVRLGWPGVYKQPAVARAILPLQVSRSESRLLSAVSGVGRQEITACGHQQFYM